MTKIELDPEKVIEAMEGKRVLLVDDNPRTRKDIAALLGSWRSNAHAVHGTNVVDYRLGDVPYDVCIADVNASCDVSRVIGSLRTKNPRMISVVMHPERVECDLPNEANAKIKKYGPRETIKATELLSVLGEYL